MLTSPLAAHEPPVFHHPAPLAPPRWTPLSGTDIFGLGIPNGKLIADKLAARTGYPVYVPDLFDGDWCDVNKMSMIEKPTTGMWNKITVYGRMIGTMMWGGLIGWMGRWTMAVSVPKMERVSNVKWSRLGYSEGDD